MVMVGSDQPPAPQLGEKLLNYQRVSIARVLPTIGLELFKIPGHLPRIMPLLILLALPLMLPEGDIQPAGCDRRQRMAPPRIQRMVHVQPIPPPSLHLDARPFC